MENYGNNGLVLNIGEVGNVTTNVEEKSMFGDYGKNLLKIFLKSSVSQIFFSQDNVENIGKAYKIQSL